MSNQQTFEQYVASTEKVAVEQLEALWDALEPISQDFMMGAWTGGMFITGHPGEKKLGALRWKGKTFHDVNNVDPMMCEDASGNVTASPLLGSASCRIVAYRGQPTATMVYDNHPIFDHFKKVDDNTVLGVMDSKGDAFPLFFWLKRSV